MRQVFEHGSEPPGPHPLKLRPFLEIFDRGRGLPALVLEGTLEPAGLRVSIGGYQSVLLTGRVQRDELGAFVQVDAQEHALGDTHALRVEPEANDRDEASHAALSYFELPLDRVARAEVSYASSWYSVYFNPRGVVDGTGLSSPRSVAPRPRTS